jgi:uncharacterized membrane protein YhaH (DUF805 family)
MDHTPLKHTEPGEVSRLLKQIEPGPQRPPLRVSQDGFWHYYLAPWSKYAATLGRARRKEYWTFHLVNLVPTVGLMAFTLATHPEARTAGSILFLLRVPGGGLLMGGILGPTVAVMARTLGAHQEIYTVSSHILEFLASASAAPGVAVGVRRLQDTGRHGAYIALAIIPFLGPLVLLVLFLLPSTSGSNAYGADPTSACHDVERP